MAEDHLTRPSASTSTRRKYIAKGLCFQCRDGTPVAPGKTMCEKHLAAHRQHYGQTHYRRYREYWMAKGLCARCGKRPHLPEKTQCETCSGRIRRREPTPEGPWEDLTGCRVGSWEVVGLIGKLKVGDFLWSVRCTNCSKAREVLTSNIRATKCLTCGDRPKGFAGLKSLYCQYRSGARGRRLVFHLTFDQFARLTADVCFYCGSEPASLFISDNEWGHYTYNGIDRADSAVGYIVANCVTSCGTCNKAKGGKTQVEFLEYVRRFASNAARGVIPCLNRLAYDPENASPPERQGA